MEIGSLATLKAFLVGIPESLGLLVFGITLVGTAVFIRWFLARGESSSTDEKISE